jgi:signal transduction histidine kinase/CheY-like chemotaxis protein
MELEVVQHYVLKSNSPIMNEKLRLELAKQYYKLAPLSSASLITLLGVTIYFYWGKIPTNLLVTWGGINFIAASLFIFASWQFKQHGSIENAGKWLKIYNVLQLLLGVPWGLIGPISFMVDDQLYRMLTLFMLAGMTAGMIITRGLIFKTYLISLCSLLTPIIVTLALQGTAISNAMLTMTLIYIIFMVATAKNYSASVIKNIQLWLDNEKLIEELQTSHAELVIAKERSDRANEAKNQFLATVSHELRTPLNGIIGFADLLQNEKLKNKEKHYINQISKAGKALQRIVSDILDITAIEAGEIRLYDEPFSLRTEIGDLIELMTPLAERKSLTLKLNIQEAVKDNLTGDISRLRQIISNLISNAVKYTKHGYVSLNISHVDNKSGKELLRFDVEDTGIGINKEALEFIFKNFTRLDSFETRESDGMGLGLAIVKSLVAKMNGKLKVKSKPDHGSCFSFELALEQSSAAEIQARHEQTSELSQRQWQKFNVLIVDDNEVNRMLLSAFLNDLGITYSEAVGGREALDLIRNGTFNLVLMDIQMPDISGINVANILNNELNPMPVMIAVTAHAFKEQRDAILDAGFYAYLTKPVIIDDLIKILTQAYQSGQVENDLPETSVIGH